VRQAGAETGKRGELLTPRSAIDAFSRWVVGFADFNPNRDADGT
jgi:hypothetical protein